ncbi:MAG: PAS domain S-box protein [Proteobacteria bacterium]|nr:PAS domain S-box protein [Pseudomonadota bacterium]
MEDPDVFIDAIHPDDRGKWHKAVRASAKRLERFDLEMRLIIPSGETKWVRSVAQPRRLANGDVAWDGVMVDITERKRAEDALRQSEARYRELFELSPDAIMVHQDGKFVFVNPAGVRLFGAERPEQLIGKPALDIVHPDFRDVARERIRQVIETEKRVSLVEEKFLRLDGTAFDAEVSGTSFHYKGRPAVQVIIRDITERRRAEEAVRESEARFRSLFEQSPIGVLEEDYSAVKPIIDRLRGQGVRDFRRYFREHPRVLRQAINAIKIIDVNQALLDAYGAPDKETYLRVAEEPARITQWMGFYEQELAALAAGETRFALEYADKAFDGSDIVIRINTHIGEAHKDSWARVVSTTEDITERKRAEDALRESEGRFRSLAANLPGVVFQRRLTSDGRLVYTYVSPGMRELYGIEPEKVIADSSAFLQVLPAEEQGRFLAALKHSARTLSPMDLELRVVSADGGTQWQRTISRPFRRESGEVVWDGVAIDITEQKRAEEALRESEARHRELFEQSPIGGLEEDYSAVKPIIDRLRRKGVRDFRRYFREHPRVLRQAINAIKIIDVNPALLDAYRAPDKETYLRAGAEPARITQWMSFYEQELATLAEGKTRFALEYADKTFDGSDIVIRTIINIGEAYKESWARIVSTEEDITERRRAEEALRESEARFRSLFEQSPIGVWEEDYSGAKRIVDRLRGQGVRDFRRYFRKHPEVLRQMAQAIKVIDVNPALIDIYRASDKEAYLQAVTDPSRIEQWCRFYEEELAALAAGEGRVVVEHADKAYDGSDIVTRTITHIGEAYKESWARVVSTAEDITEREAMQAQLIQAEKLSTLGEMAAGIAHELSQPLNIIRMAADSSLMLIEEGDADLDYQKEQLALIGGQTQRMADIIDHMRIFSRKDDMDAELFDASASVRNALGLVHEAIHLADIRVAAKVPERCRHVLGHAVQLEQVMVSLLTNAADAILAHPVPAGDRSRGKQQGRITVNLVDDKTSNWIWIIVSDTGGGIPDDVIGHIFEPFYTTKELGKGTGLGLSVAYGIVTAMGGRIDVWNTAKGARFQIALPVAGDGPRRASVPPRPPGDQG